MRTLTGFVVGLDRVRADDLATVGGKAANLGELAHAGFPVPPAFIVSTDSYKRFVAQDGLLNEIERSLVGIDPEDSAALDRVSTTIRRRMLETPVPADVAAEIHAAYRQLGAGPVAVRSSATAEDLPEASFAGLQSTYLNIEGEADVEHAVRRCWASLFEARAIYYRALGGWDQTDVALAVVVQRMIQSETAGVIFTIDPTTNDPSCIVIEAVYGLGEAAVSGVVTPDHYTLDKRTLALLESRTAVQDRALRRLRPKGQPARNVWRPIAAARQGQPKLTAEPLRELADLGRRIEAHYGTPQDIEWAREAGTSYIVQARPVTTAARVVEPSRSRPVPTQSPILTGAAASPGVAAGLVRIVRSEHDLRRVAAGDVIVAEMTSPDFVPAMRRAAAIVTDHGGRTCHAAIISRELGVPCVVGTGSGTTRLTARDVVTVDGAEGRVWAGREQALLSWWAAEEEDRPRATDLPKTRTRIYVNLADPEIAERVAAQPVDGVGLLRAEFMIARMGKHPRRFLQEGQPQAFVRQLGDGIDRIARAFAPRPVVYRASDFKTNEYRKLEGGDEFEPLEANPMLGYRGAARYVKEPELFRLELEAVKRVSDQRRNLHLMIPFVRTPKELGRVARMVEEAGLQRGPHFQLWMMVEIPSNVLLLDAFIDQGLDGLSIGSNDLTQLVLGVDRDNEQLADLFEEREPAVMWAIQRTIETARRRGVTVSICGQGPSEHPDLAAQLVAWGITSISVTPDVLEASRRLVAQAEAQTQAGPLPTTDPTE